MPSGARHMIDRFNSRLTLLSEGQLQVLALVAEFKSSKTIARTLGIAPSTVDQRVKRILHLLRVSTRSEAARLFVAEKSLLPADARGLCSELVHQSPVISSSDDSGDEDASLGREGRPGDGPSALHEAHALYLSRGRSDVSAGSWVAGLLEAGRKNELSPFWRTVLIGSGTFVAVASVAAVVSIAEGLSRIF